MKYCNFGVVGRLCEASLANKLVCEIFLREAGTEGVLGPVAGFYILPGALMDLILGFYLCQARSYNCTNREAVTMPRGGKVVRKQECKACCGVFIS